MGLEPWFDAALEDLLYGAMLPSGKTRPSPLRDTLQERGSVRGVDEKARQLGLKSPSPTPRVNEANHYRALRWPPSRYGMQYSSELAAATSYDIAEQHRYTIENLNPPRAYPEPMGLRSVIQMTQ